MGDGYPILTKTLTIGPEDVLTLRGLSFPHIITIVQTMAEPMTGLYAKAVAGDLEASTPAIAMQLGPDFGQFIGMVIALGANDIERMNHFAFDLPLGHQVAALEIIIGLTVEGVGGLGKLQEIIIKAFKAAVDLQKRQKG